MARYVFKEEQRFNQLWVWTLITLAIVMTISSIKSTPTTLWEIIIPIIILSSIVLLFGKIQLNTRIDERGLSFSYFPFIKKRTFSIDHIQKLELIEYNSLLKYGGWGIRYNFDMWAYNISGKHGLVVHLKDKKFLLGTQKPEEMKKAIEQFSILKGGDHAS